MKLTRRGIGLALAAALALAAVPASAADKEVRVGFQKYGVLVLLKGKGLLEEKLAPLGYTVKWAEFAAGPQMLEALRKLAAQCRAEFSVDGKWSNDGQLVTQAAVKAAESAIAAATGEAV